MFAVVTAEGYFIDIRCLECSYGPGIEVFEQGLQHVRKTGHKLQIDTASREVYEAFDGPTSGPPVQTLRAWSK